MPNGRIGGATAGPFRRLGPDYRPPASLVFKAASGPLSQIEALTAKLEKSLALAILEAFTKQQNAVELDALAAALEAGDIGKVLSLLQLPAALAAFDTVPPVIHAGVTAAGSATAAGIAMRLGGVTFAFNTLNPRLITWLQSYSLGLIRQINDQTREGVRQFLIDGMKAGEGPKATARDVKGIIGLTERQAKAVANYRKQLETFHLRRSADGFNLGGKIDRVNGTQVLRPDADGLPKDKVYERRLRDFRYDGQLKRSLETGKPLSPAQIDKMVKAYQRKYLAYRARTIARTEAVRANNVGVQDAWHQAIEKGVAQEELVRKKWIVARDERLCETCGPIPSMNPKVGVKHGQPFMTPDGPQSLPPMHPNCRCTVFYRQYEPSQLVNA